MTSQSVGENSNYLFPELEDPAFEERLQRALDAQQAASLGGGESAVKLIKRAPPRPGLLPQSGDWQHPARWVRPSDVPSQGAAVRPPPSPKEVVARRIGGVESLSNMNRVGLQAVLDKDPDLLKYVHHIQQSDMSKVGMFGRKGRFDYDATTQEGTLTLDASLPEYAVAGVVRHEAGHGYWVHMSAVEKAEFTVAWQSEKATQTSYGKSNVAEGFAEVVREMAFEDRYKAQPLQRGVAARMLKKYG